MNTEKLHIALYTIPQAACDQKKMSWNDVAKILEKQMYTSFHDMVSFKHIEFMSEEWFTDTIAQALLESGTVNFPFVLVNGEVACSEKKVNISKIRRFAETKLITINTSNNLQL
ncbi:MAG: hypothetical protein U5K51_09915 [Flavobacteriaceae bacterium]|nr:hypothetical protein [Flavobacteriaceae bacterium]